MKEYSNCLLCKREIVESVQDKYCCQGCSAVAQIVDKMALTGEEREQKIEMLLQEIFSEPISKKKEINSNVENYLKELRLWVTEMVCPACSWIIHYALSKMPGIHQVSGNFITESFSIQYDPMVIGEESIIKKIKSLGHGISFEQDHDQQQLFNIYQFGAGWFFTLNIMMLSFVVYSAETWHIPTPVQWICAFLLVSFTVLTMTVAARTTLVKGWGQIINLKFRMEALIVLSTTFAMIYSLYSLGQRNFPNLYFDVVSLLLMLLETGNLITKGLYLKLRKRINGLNSCVPKKIRLAPNDDATIEDYLLIDQLEGGEKFSVRTGELVPIDGILKGNAEFDFSLINGESRGVYLQNGQIVGAGSKLLTADVVLSIPDKGPSSLLKKIIESTVAAFNTSDDHNALGDRLAQIFIPVVLMISLFGGGYYWWAEGILSGLLTMMRVLIVACPCAFGIAGPLVVITAIDRIKKIGLQIVNGNALAKLPDMVIFDKTGTLTHATMTVQKIEWLGEYGEEKKKYMDIIASLESGIEHPISYALRTLGNKLSVNNRVIETFGVLGEVKGKTYFCGRCDYYKNLSMVDQLEQSDQSVLAFGDQQECKALIYLNDTLREDAKVVVKQLQKQQLEIHICSGDKQKIVERMARQLGITNFHGRMTPDDKQKYIQEFQQQGKHVMMIGDGINDSQSLSQANCGIAVFSGQLPSQMSSDMVMLRSDLTIIAKLLSNMKIIRRRILSNYGWSFLYNFVGITLALSGTLTPTFCAVGMVFSNMVVIYNSLRR